MSNEALFAHACELLPGGVNSPVRAFRGVGGEPVLFRPTGAPINENRDFPSPEMHDSAADLLLPEIQRLLR